MLKIYFIFEKVLVYSQLHLNIDIISIFNLKMKRALCCHLKCHEYSSLLHNVTTNQSSLSFITGITTSHNWTSLLGGYGPEKAHDVALMYSSGPFKWYRKWLKKAESVAFSFAMMSALAHSPQTFLLGLPTWTYSVPSSKSSRVKIWMSCFAFHATIAPFIPISGTMTHL